MSTATAPAPTAASSPVRLSVVGDGRGAAARIKQLTAEVAAVFDAAFAAFGSCSTGERFATVDAVTEFALQHQSHLARFAQVIEHADSTLSSVAKDLHYSSTANLLQHGKRPTGRFRGKTGIVSPLIPHSPRKRSVGIVFPSKPSSSCVSLTGSATTSTLTS